MENFDVPCSHEYFAQLVGVSRQAISKHVESGVLSLGATPRRWMLEYTAHLREHSAGRGDNGELARQRSELARVSRERAEIKLALERKESVPVAAVTAVLAAVSRGIVSALEPLPNMLHKAVADLSPEGLKIVQQQVAKACDLAAMNGLQALDFEDESDAAEDDDFLEGVDDD